MTLLVAHNRPHKLNVKFTLVDVYLYSFFNLGVKYGIAVSTTPDHFIPGKELISIV
jgi:hypothetical protein